MLTHTAQLYQVTEDDCPQGSHRAWGAAPHCLHMPLRLLAAAGSFSLSE